MQTRRIAYHPLVNHIPACTVQGVSAWGVSAWGVSAQRCNAYGGVYPGVGYVADTISPPRNQRKTCPVDRMTDTCNKINRQLFLPGIIFVTYVTSLYLRHFYVCDEPGESLHACTHKKPDQSNHGLLLSNDLLLC